MRVWTLLIFLGGFGSLKAQVKTVELRYQNLTAFEWNKAVRTYNFSRPFLENKQPLIQQGFGIGYSKLKSKKENRLSGFEFSLSGYRSAVKNENYEVALNALTLGMGYEFRFDELFEKSEMNFLLVPKMQAIGLGRWQDGDLVALEFEESTTRLLTVGACLGLGTAVQIPVGKKSSEKLTYLKLGLEYYPFWWTYQSQVLLNQSVAGPAIDFGSALLFHIGISHSWFQGDFKRKPSANQTP
jgi:hypothetical protein